MDVPVPNRENARELDDYQKETVAMLGEFQRLALPWHYFAWRKMKRIIEARNANVREALAWRRAERDAGKVAVVNRRVTRHTSPMRKTAHGDVTALTVAYAFLFGAIIAGRWGWGSVAVYVAVTVPVGVWWLDRRMQEYRRLG